MQFKEWYYLEEQHDFGTLLLENFGQKRAQFIAQGAKPSKIDQYFALFDKIRKARYKQFADQIPRFDLPIEDRLDISNYNNFNQLKIFVDYMASQVNLEKKSSDDIETSGKIIFEDDVLEIFRADTPQACVQYKGNIQYRWCIARPDSGNRFYRFRFGKSEPTFYFVKNKIRTQKEFENIKPSQISPFHEFKDGWHFFIIQVFAGVDVEDQLKIQYLLTSANNTGESATTWAEILKIEPALAGKQALFKHNPLSDTEKKFYDKYRDGMSNKKFREMTFREKSKFIDVFVRTDNFLTDNQFAALPDDLKNKYINLGVGLSNKQFESIKENKKLLARYIKVTKEKIKKFINNKQSLKLTFSEQKILDAHLDIIDWNMLTDEQLQTLLANSNDKQTMAKFIIQNKTGESKLSPNTIEELEKIAKGKT